MSNIIVLRGHQKMISKVGFQKQFSRGVFKKKVFLKYAANLEEYKKYARHFSEKVMHKLTTYK